MFTFEKGEATFQHTNKKRRNSGKIFSIIIIWNIKLVESFSYFFISFLLKQHGNNKINQIENCCNGKIILYFLFFFVCYFLASTAVTLMLFSNISSILLCLSLYMNTVLLILCTILERLMTHKHCKHTVRFMLNLIGV